MTKEELSEFKVGFGSHEEPISEGMSPLKLTLSGGVSALRSWAKLFQRFWQRSSTATVAVEGIHVHSWRISQMASFQRRRERREECWEGGGADE